MKHMFSDIDDPKERLRLLRDNCDATEQTTYLKDLSPHDLDVKREQITENLIQLSTWEDELTNVKDSYKTMMKPVKEANLELLDQVKTGKEEIKGVLFDFADHENGVMNTYDEKGEFVKSRRLRPEERQAKLFVAKPAANDE